MASKPSAIGASEGAALWVGELCFTWLGVLLMAVAPAVLFGSAIFSIGVLAVAVFIGVPSAIFDSQKALQIEDFCRLAVMLVVPALTFAYCPEVDQRIPQNATPLLKPSSPFSVKPEPTPKHWRLLFQSIWQNSRM